MLWVVVLLKSGYWNGRGGGEVDKSEGEAEEASLSTLVSSYSGGLPLVAL